MKSMNMSMASSSSKHGDLYQEAQDGIQKALGKLDLATLEETIMTTRRTREVQALYIWGNQPRQVLPLDQVASQIVNI